MTKCAYKKASQREKQALFVLACFATPLSCGTFWNILVAFQAVLCIATSPYPCLTPASPWAKARGFG